MVRCISSHFHFRTAKDITECAFVLSLCEAFCKATDRQGPHPASRNVSGRKLYAMQVSLLCAPVGCRLAVPDLSRLVNPNISALQLPKYLAFRYVEKQPCFGPDILEYNPMTILSMSEYSKYRIQNNIIQ